MITSILNLEQVGLKVTPAHDINDYNLGLKHGLETIEIIDDHGKLNEKSRILYWRRSFLMFE